MGLELVKVNGNIWFTLQHVCYNCNAQYNYSIMHVTMMRHMHVHYNT